MIFLSVQQFDQHRSGNFWRVITCFHSLAFLFVFKCYQKRNLNKLRYGNPKFLKLTHSRSLKYSIKILTTLLWKEFIFCFQLLIFSSANISFCIVLPSSFHFGCHLFVRIVIQNFDFCEAANSQVPITHVSRSSMAQHLIHHKHALLN